jgi:hypothetical protein
MDWLRSELSFRNGKKRVEYPAVSGEVYENAPVSLEMCSDFLGAVLWMDAVGLFLPFLATDLKGVSQGTCLCLGEGTGAVGCALAGCDFFDSIFITDLPQLLPLLEVNASLVPSKRVAPHSLDWTQPLPSHLAKTCDVIIGCEVLYGNRSVWPGLLDTIRSAATRESVVYLCVTLRNKRHDVDDFRSEFLSKIFADISEHTLSENVVVLRATGLVSI